MDEHLIDSQATDARSQNKRLGRGVNMGNMLEAPRGGWDGELLVLKPDYFKMIRDQGFNSVRIPIRWSDYAAPTEPYTIEPDFFSQVDSSIEAALLADLAVIINTHHYEEIFIHPFEHEERLLGLWKQIAGRYKSYSSDLMFEVLNEPHDALTNEVWNPLVGRAVEVIRAIDPPRTLLVGPGNWNGIAGLEGFVPPRAENIVLSVHYYLPMQFTHQGASWTPGSDAWLGTTWTASDPEQTDVFRNFDLASAFAQKYNLPVNLGEFGAYEKADQDSRVRWTDFIVREVVERGWSFHYWEFCSGFGIYDPVRKVWRLPLLKALVP